MEAESLSVCTAHGDPAAVRAGVKRGREAEGTAGGSFTADEPAAGAEGGAVFDEAALCLVL